MKFKLSRQILTSEINKIILRERRKQKLSVSKATKENMREIQEVSKIIEEKGLPDYLVRRKLPGKLGYGIFLHPKAKPIEKGQVIACYSGQVLFAPQNDPLEGSYAFTPIENIVLKKGEHPLFDKMRKYHPRRLYSMFVDAKKTGNFTRFINHSDKPNVSAHLYTIPSNSFGLLPSPIEVVYFAKKTIRPGEQLLVCYEDEEKAYWGSLKIKPFPMTPKTFQLTSSLKLVKLA